MGKTLHFKANDISRNKARPDNAVKACAYRCGQNLTDTKTGETHRYAGRNSVIRAAIFAPSAAPQWLRDDDQKRAWQRLGNEIEWVEDSHNKRASALLAIDWHGAAPRELTLQQAWEKIAVPFARKLNERGLLVAVALHETDASDGGKNPHFHFFVPQREVTKQGFGRRYRAFTGRPGKPNPEHKQLRREYFALVNDALSDAGISGVTYDPEKQEGKPPGVHKGKVGTAIERKAVERAKRDRWAAMEAFLRPALASLQETGETYQEGIGATWWERAQAGLRQEEEAAPLPPVPPSWRDRAARPSPPRSR